MTAAMEAAYREPVELVAPAAARNLRVKGPLWFGDNVRGTVMPAWAAEMCGRTAEELVADGTMEWTDAEVVKSFKAPPARDDSDPSPALAEENNRLRRENAKLLGEHKAALAECDEYRARVTLQVKALGEQETELSRLKSLCDGHKARADSFEAEAGRQRKQAEAASARVAELELQLAAERDARKPAETTTTKAAKK